MMAKSAFTDLWLRIKAAPAGKVLTPSSLENRAADRKERMARLKAANRSSKLSNTSTSFMPVGFRAEIKNLQYDLRNTMLEVGEEKAAVARDLASLRELEERDPPHNLDVKDTGTSFVRKNGSSNLHQIPAYLEYCQMKDLNRATHCEALDTSVPSDTGELALVPVINNNRGNLAAVVEDFREQKALIESRIATADEEAVPVLKEELEHVERMLLEAEATMDF